VLEDARRQAGVITYQQALRSGLSADNIQSLLEHGVWQRLHRGIYATFSGPVSRPAMIWAALLAAGPGAVLSHESAAEAAGLLDEPARRIHVTIPAPRHVKAPIEGVVIHRSTRIATSRHPVRQPPQTRVEETVLDLADASRTLDAAVAWLGAACARRRTTPTRIADALAGRKKIRWRRELTAALADIESGAHSPLELRYLRDVERAHDLPGGTRQLRHDRLGGHYDDVRYDVYGVVAELDGRAAHAESTFRDLDRDNVAARRGDLVLHYGWDDVGLNPCRVASEVAHVLGRRGWLGRPRRCKRPDCMIVGPR
jgi:very-short-patch-repair endonuclease